MGTVLLSHVDTTIAEKIRVSVVDWPRTSISEITKPEAILARLGEGDDPVDALVLGTEFEDPVRVAQVVHSRDRDLSVLILNDPGNGEHLKRAVLYSPFLGPEVCCWPQSPVEDLTLALGDAVVRTQQRRRYRDMVEASKQYTTALDPGLIQPGEYLDRLLDHAPIGVVLLDERWLTAALNRRARDLLEVSERDALERSLREFVLDTDAARMTKFLAHCAASSRTTAPDRYARVLGNGTRQHLEMTGTAISSSGGRHCTMIIIQDVTERAHAEQRRQRLINELDHRVKNNLAMVISLAEQTFASAASPENFVGSFKGRIHALARVHEALAATRWEGVDLTEVIRLTLEPHAAGAWHRIAIRGDPLLLPARAAPILCMTLHELATNAVKYGSFSNANGLISIEWRCDSDGGLELRWEESGGPNVAPTGRKGFGSEVIQELVRFELSGNVDLDFAAKGLRCTITLPPPHDDALPA